MHFLRSENRNTSNIAVSGKSGAQTVERIQYKLPHSPQSIRVKRLRIFTKQYRAKILPGCKP
jgi:hypothetical protein